MRSNNENMKGFDVNAEISVEDEDMCRFCWQIWKDTGVRPLIDESKCLDCERPLRGDESRGRFVFNALLCLYCGSKEELANIETRRKGRNKPQVEVDSDEEQDDFSPYHIHT